MPDFVSTWVRRFNAGSAFASYLFITLILTFPLVRSLSWKLPSDLGDPVLNTWVLWWNTQAVPFTERWWNPPAFYPTPDILAYSEHLLGLTPFSTPIYWLTGSPILAYNVTFLLTFPLAGWAAYLLCEELTGRRDAAWIAGLAFAFAPYRMSQLGHLQVLASFWMPLALFGLHRYYSRGGVRWLGLFGVSTLMQGLSNGYYLAYFPVLVLLWVCWFTPNEGWWRKVGAIGLTGVLTTLPVLPILFRYQRVHEALGLRRDVAEIERYSADLTSFLSGSTLLTFWSRFDTPVLWFQQPEGQLFPGVAVLVVLAAALWRVRWWPQGPEPVALRALRVLVTTTAVLFAAGLAYRFIVGPWEINPFGWKVAMNRPDQAIPQTVLACVVALVVSRAGAWAYRRHSAFAFYLLAAFLLAVLAMGPHPSVLGTSIMTHSPYLGLMQLPGFDGLRVPARFWMLALVCLSPAVAIGYARLVPATIRRGGLVLMVLAGGILLDGWGTVPTVNAPKRSAVLDDRADGPVLELPLGWRDDDVAAMLRSAHHGQPVVNGHSGYAAPHYGALAYGLGHSREQLLHELGALGVRHIRIDRTNPTAPHYESLVASSPVLRLVAETGTESLYEFREIPVSEVPVTADGVAIPLSDVATNTNGHLVGFAADGDLETRWFSGPQSMGHQLILDLGVPSRVRVLVMRLGSHRMDFPRMLGIELSIDGQAWELVRGGPTDDEAVRASFRDPYTMPLTFDLGDRLARFVRLRQMGHDETFYWSVAEVEVIAPSS